MILSNILFCWLNKNFACFVCLFFFDGCFFWELNCLPPNLKLNWRRIRCRVRKGIGNGQKEIGLRAIMVCVVCSKSRRKGDGKRFLRWCAREPTSSQKVEPKVIAHQQKSNYIFLRKAPAQKPFSVASFLAASLSPSPSAGLRQGLEAGQQQLVAGLTIQR